MSLISCVRVLPGLSRRLVSPSVLPGAQQVRTLFDPWSRSSDIRALVRDMDRQMARLERDMFRGFPSSFTSVLPQMVPVSFDNTTNPTEGGQYRVAVDVSGFKPEEIDISLDDSRRRLTIQAKCERAGKDGSRFKQEISRVLTLPEAIDTAQLKSLLHNDGYLAVEAPYKEQHEQPRQIPISKHGEDAAATPQLEQKEGSS